MICPKCANEKTQVKGTIKGLVNVRMRICPACGYCFATKEILNEDGYAKKYNDYLENINEINSKERS